MKLYLASISIVAILICAKFSAKPSQRSFKYGGWYFDLLSDGRLSAHITGDSKQDVAPIINEAIQQAKPNEIIFVPTGHYSLDSPLRLDLVKESLSIHCNNSVFDVKFQFTE